MTGADSGSMILLLDIREPSLMKISEYVAKLLDAAHRTVQTVVSFLCVQVFSCRLALNAG